MELNLSLIWYHSYQLGIAFLLALPIALNREYKAHGAGMRTYPLVSIACCAFMLVARDVYEGDAAEARVMYGIITGMGFIGGGAILKNGSSVTGLATAASLWGTAAIGIAVGTHRLEIALLLSIVTFITLQVMAKVKSKVPENEERCDNDT